MTENLLENQEKANKLLLLYSSLLQKEPVAGVLDSAALTLSRETLTLTMTLLLFCQDQHVAFAGT